MNDMYELGYNAGLTFMDRHIEKLVKYAERTKTRSLCHASVPAWRARGFSSAVYLFNRIKQIPEYHLSDIIEAIEQFIVSFNNSTGGYYERWEAMKLEFEERLEERQETEGPEEDSSVREAAICVPIDRQCIPVNCKFCEHHGYLHDDTSRDNVYTSAYSCDNPEAERYGLLMGGKGGLLCKHAVGNQRKILSYVAHVSVDTSVFSDYLKTQGKNASSIISIERKGDNLWMHYIA